MKILSNRVDPDGIVTQLRSPARRLSLAFGQKLDLGVIFKLCYDFIAMTSSLRARCLPPGHTFMNPFLDRQLHKLLSFGAKHFLNI